MQRIKNRVGKDLTKHFQWTNPLAIDMITKMLVFDPAQRISVEDALAHPYLAKLHAPEDEPTGEQLQRFDFDFELYSLKTHEYKELIFEEIKLYYEESAVENYMQQRQEHPDGILWRKFGKDRLRTMYKKDKELKIEGELVIKKSQKPHNQI